MTILFNSWKHVGVIYHRPADVKRLKYFFFRESLDINRMVDNFIIISQYLGQLLCLCSGCFL